MIAVILLIAFLITGCEDKSAKTDHIIRIGVVTYTQDDPFINAMTDQLKENLKKMETDHMKIITTVKNGDDNQQDQNLGVDGGGDNGGDLLGRLEHGENPGEHRGAGSNEQHGN